MNNSSNNKDEITKKILEKAGMEQPSFSFTSNIMERIRLSQLPEVFTYQPVIKMKIWLLLAAIFVSVLVFIPTLQSAGSFEFARYFMPVQNMLNSTANGLIEKLSLLHSFSWMAFAIAAGWLLFGMDKILRNAQARK